MTASITLISDPITDGTVGSASKILGVFGDLQNQGQISINQLVTLRENTLILFSNAMEELNGKRVQVNRLPEVGIAVKFVASDLEDINQPITTATSRTDSNSFSLRERSTPGEAVVSQVQFSASEGTIQALQVPRTGSSGNLGALYRVATATGSTPTGTFNVQLLTAVGVSLIIFDMMDTPSNPNVTAATSANGINYTPALSITNNGSRWAAWFTPQDTQYIQITITPALPDTLGGNVFTFGLTDVYAFSVQYHLLSDVYTNQLQFIPRSTAVQFDTLTVPGLLYFLSLAGNPAIEVFPGSQIAVPGTAAITHTSIGLIAHTGSAWAGSTSYTVGNHIIDSNGNLQTVASIAGSGTSGSVHPTWSVIGGETVDNPGANQIVWLETAWAQVNLTLPSDTYLSTLKIVDHTTQAEIRTAPGLPKTSVGMSNQYIVVNSDGTMDLVIYNHAVDQSRTFDISYITGPPAVTASLQVQLTTSDLNNTPTYSGAQLLEV